VRAAGSEQVADRAHWPGVIHVLFTLRPRADLELGMELARQVDFVAREVR
jgi:hypothetical protein